MDFWNSRNLKLRNAWYVQSRFTLIVMMTFFLNSPFHEVLWSFGSDCLFSSLFLLRQHFPNNLFKPRTKDDDEDGFSEDGGCLTPRSWNWTCGRRTSALSSGWPSDWSYWCWRCCWCCCWSTGSLLEHWALRRFVHDAVVGILPSWNVVTNLSASC